MLVKPSPRRDDAYTSRSVLVMLQSFALSSAFRYRTSSQTRQPPGNVCHPAEIDRCVDVDSSIRPST